MSNGTRPVPKRLLAVRKARLHGARLRAATISQEAGQVADLLERLAGLRSEMLPATGHQSAAAMRQAMEMGDRVGDAVTRAGNRLSSLQRECAAAELERERADRMLEKIALAMKQRALLDEQIEAERLPPRRRSCP